MKRYRCVKGHLNGYELDGYGGACLETFEVKPGMVALVDGENVTYPDLELKLRGKDAIDLECFVEDCDVSLENEAREYAKAVEREQFRDAGMRGYIAGYLQAQREKGG